MLLVVLCSNLCLVFSTKINYCLLGIVLFRLNLNLLIMELMLCLLKSLQVNLLVKLGY